jgi:hypothetical protein
MRRQASSKVTVALPNWTRRRELKAKGLKAKAEKLKN